MNTMFSPSVYAGTIAAMVKHHGADYAGINDVRRQLAESKLERFIQKEVAKCPPLKPEQIERLSALLKRGEA